MASANGLRVVGYFDCPGGGQVVVRNKIAYVGHVKPPDGTTIIDVHDPSKPRQLAEIKLRDGTLSHKVRVENDVMLVNREVFPIGRVDADFRGGHEVFDVSRPATPKRITTWSARGTSHLSHRSHTRFTHSRAHLDCTVRPSGERSQANECSDL
jgi:hypothetical protein